MEILCLGAGNAFAPGDLGWNGFAVDDHLLLDAPPDVLARLNQLRIATTGVDTVLLSHFHPDHFSGLPALMLHMAIQDRRKAPLVIVGPPGVEGRVEDLSVAMGLRRRDRGGGFERRYVEVEDGRELVAGGFSLVAREMRHAPHLRAFGYRLRAAAGVLAYSGDTTMCPALVELAAGADLLIVECSSASVEDTSHMNLRMVRELRMSLGPAPRILLTHRSTDVTADGIENAAVASPGERYRVGSPPR